MVTAVSISVLESLGDLVDRRWRETDYRDDAFPEIAAHALTEACLSERLRYDDVVAWGLSTPRLPGQRDPGARFGDPPLTVWECGRFYIDVYFWWHGTTTIHQHAFAGAFAVLHGGSMHGVYEFEPSRELGYAMRFGTLALQHVELLTVGDVRPIVAGPRFIHSLFHLEEPSVTVVVRTGHAPLSPPQFNYVRSGLAVDPFFEDRVLGKQLQLLTMCFRNEQFDAEARTMAMLREADLHSCSTILSTVRPMLQGTAVQQMVGVNDAAERFERLLGVVQERDQEAATILRAVFAERDSTAEISGRRSFVTDPELRFFLALVLNVPDAHWIARLVKDRHPDSDPVEKILDWIAELGTMRIAGSTLPNALGVPDFTDDDVVLLEHMLSGGDDASSARASARGRELREHALLRPFVDVK
jgi:hypothetical protein